MSTAEEKLSVHDAEKSLRQIIDESVGAMSKDQADALSKVLFPDTHTNEVQIEGKKYTLSPLPLKVSKIISHLLSEFAEDYSQAVSTDVGEAYDAGSHIADRMKAVCEALCEHYHAKYPEAGWDELRKKVSEEELVIDDMQALVVRQQSVQGTNDFLLVTLRLLILAMQMQEIMTIADLSLCQSMSITRRS